MCGNANRSLSGADVHGSRRPTTPTRCFGEMEPRRSTCSVTTTPTIISTLIHITDMPSMRTASRSRRWFTLARRVGQRWVTLSAITDDPQSTKAWERGAVGEEGLAKALADIAGVGVLADRRVRNDEAAFS